MFAPLRTRSNRLCIPCIIVFCLTAFSHLENTSAAVTESSPELGKKALLELDQILPVPEFPKPEASGKPASEHEPDPRAVRYLNKGRSRFDEQLWGEAIAALEKALQFDPALLEARILLARAGLQHGNHGLAESHLREVLKQRPRDMAAHQMLGEMAWLQDRPDEAIRELRLVLMAAEDEPDRPEAVLARLTLAMALHKQGYLAAAAEQLEAYLEKVEHPTKAMNQYHELKEVMVLFRGTAAGIVGEIQTKLKAHDKAVAAYRRAVKETPDEPGLRKRFVYALAHAGKADEALSETRKWLADFPREANGFELLKEVCDLLGRPELYDREIIRSADKADPASRLQLARLLAKRDKVPEAIEILEEVADEPAVESDVGYMMARLHERNGDFAKSYERILKTFRAHPKSDEMLFSLFSDEQVDLSKFIEPARNVATQKPDDAFARCILGLLLSARGQDDEALVELEAATRLNSDLGAAFVALAELHKKKKRWQDVITTADAAIENGVQSSRVYFIKGIAHDALSETDNAEAAWLDAFRLDRRSAEPLFHLAESAERRGEHRRCEQLYRRIVDDVDPRYHRAREKLVRFYVLSGRPQEAQEYFSDFQRLNHSGPMVERCRALMDLFTDRKLTGKARVEAYQDALMKIINDYPRDTRTYLDIAISYRDLNQFEKALEYTDQALQIDPDDFPTRELHYHLLAKLLRFDDAAEVVHGLLEDRPRDWNYLRKLLEFTDIQSDYDKVIALIRRMLGREDLSDRHALFAAQLILTHIITGQYEAAADAAKDWLDAAPDEPLRRRIYLITLTAADRHDEAVALARSYLDKDPTNRDLQVRYLTCLQGADRHMEAQQLTLQWLADEPEDLALNNMLISLCVANDQWDDAIEIARTGAELSEDRGRYESLLGMSYRIAGRHELAIDFYRDKANELERKRKQFEGQLGEQAFQIRLEEANLALVRVLTDAERYDEAEQIVNKLLRPQLAAKKAGLPYDSDLIIRMRMYLVGILQQTDRQAQAIQQMEETYEQLLAEGHDIQNRFSGTSLSRQRFVGVSNDLGYSWADAGTKLDEAEKMIRFALAEDPRSYAYLDSLGWVLYKRGHFDKAVHYLRWALRSSRRDYPIFYDDLDSTLFFVSEAIRVADRDDPVIHDHLADALYRSGKPDEARTHWEKALELSDPKRDSPPDRERRRLYGKIKAKLEQLSGDKPVTTAEIVGPATSQPSPGVDDAKPPSPDL